MKTMIRAIALVTTVAGCQSLSGPPKAEVQVSTTETEYVLPAEGAAEVGFTVTNEGSTTVYLDRCGDRITAVLDRAEGVVWEQYSGGACPAIYDMSPLPLAPGETIESARAVHEPGRYRIRVGTSAGADGSAERWEAASNLFVVE